MEKFTTDRGLLSAVHHPRCVTPDRRGQQAGPGRDDPLIRRLQPPPLPHTARVVPGQRPQPTRRRVMPRRAPTHARYFFLLLLLQIHSFPPLLVPGVPWIKMDKGHGLGFIWDWGYLDMTNLWPVIWEAAAPPGGEVEAGVEVLSGDSFWPFQTNSSN